MLLPLRPLSRCVCPWVSLCGLCVLEAQCRVALPRPPRWPRAPALPSQEPAAPEVSHVAEVCYLFIKSCVCLLVWGGVAVGGGLRPAMPRKRRLVADGDARAAGADRSAQPTAPAGAAAEAGRASAGTEVLGRGGQRGAGDAASLSLRVRSEPWFPEASGMEEAQGQLPKLLPKVDTSALAPCARPWRKAHVGVDKYSEPPSTPWVSSPVRVCGIAV